MTPVVIALVLGVGWLVLRAARLRRDRAEGTSWAGAAVVAAVAAVLVAWLAVEQLMVTSGRLADTLQRVYTVSSPDARGPLGLLAAAELELDESLGMTEEGRDRTGDAEVTRFEVTDRFVGVPVGRACLEERLVRLDGQDSRSYTVRAGGC